MAQDLVKKLNDAEWQGELESLTEIAESLFTHVCNAKGEAAAEKEKNMVLMREIQRLEERNGMLCTELDRAEEQHRRVKEEVEQLSNSLKHLLDEIRNCKEDNARLSTENYQLETQIRQMAAKMAEERIATSAAPPAAEPMKIRRQTSSEDARPRNDDGALGAAECPKCGSAEGKEENGDPSGGCAVTSLCAREALGAAECPKCGNMFTELCETNGLWACHVCGTHYEVTDNG